jgi:hypothetical protein
VYSPKSLTGSGGGEISRKIATEIVYELKAAYFWIVYVITNIILSGFLQFKPLIFAFQCFCR